ncbi:hypothetical protein [Chitinophaga rhizosphaerae]|uniref:hypothetical protein n=1 Tax=Chitinophaga rhizosphaerae TaxID=1864947 RepID=UPI0013DFCA89|nr:hypothetical protein [Chitinophaga rhizosphaerae]
MEKTQEKRSGTGLYDYLPFMASRQDGGDEAAQNVKPGEYAYFSVTIALCHLLTADIVGMDRRVRHGMVSDHYIFDQMHDRFYGQIVVYRPGNGTQQLEGYGVYFESDLPATKLRLVTGIPFVGSTDNDSSCSIQLASYSNDFNQLVLTENCILLQAWAREYLATCHAADYGMNYQLVFKGKTDWHMDQNHYVEHHYYESPYQAAKRLLLEDVRIFNPYSNKRLADRTHGCAYIVGPTNEPLATMLIMSIDDAPDGYPSAGIYISAPSTIEEFAEIAKIYLEPSYQYDPGSPVLLRAHFKYDNGYQLIEPEEQQQFIKEVANDQHVLDKVVPVPYNFSCHYEFDRSAGRNFLWGSDDHYYTTVERALLKLVTSDLYIWKDRKIDAYRPVIASRFVVRLDNQTLAELQLKTRDPEGDTEIMLTMEHKLAAVMPTTFAAIQSTFGSLLINEGNCYSLTVATIDPLGFINYSPKTFPALRRLLIEASGLKIDQHMMLAMVKPVPHPPGVPTYGIELFWNKIIESGQKQTHFIPCPSIDAAHDMLLQFDTQFFRVNPDAPDEPFLLCASLVDRTTRNTLVSRFYKDVQECNLRPGFYLQYNHTQERAMRLADQAHNRLLIENATSEYVHTFRQIIQGPQQLARCHAREFRELEQRDMGKRTGV